VLLALGSLAPIVKSALPAVASPSGIDFAQLGYVFLAAAATCIGADKYLGYSSSWSRDTLAATAIKNAVADFRFSWVGLTAKRRGQRATDEDITAMTELCKDLITRVNKIIQEKTVSWDKESRNLQADLEAQTKAAGGSR
jgi:hypothetical protein